MIRKISVGLIILLSLLVLATAFPDSDRDGVPDSKDKCSSSPSTIVDQYGCDCSQIHCGSASCLVVKMQPKCVLSTPEEVISLAECSDCHRCGCQEGFTCQASGACEKEVALQGKRCKTQDFFYSLTKIDCQSKGKSWIEEDPQKYISYEVGGVASGVPFLNDYLQDKAKEKFDQVTVCFNTADLGCTNGKMKCFGENQLTDENKKKASALLEQELETRTDMPWYADPFVSINFKVDLSSFQIDIPYDCSPLKLNQKDACKALIQNGPSASQIDLLFIADGYNSDEEIKKDLAKIVDYSGNQSLTKASGIFSEKIFQDNKYKFNILYLNAKGKVRYGLDAYISSYGRLPFYYDVVSLANKCPDYDYIIFISQDKKFRSNCMLGSPGPCRISLAGEEYPGRLVLHEFGHGFASLADEYYNYVKRKKTTSRFEQLFVEFQTGPNCQKNQLAAMNNWGSLAGSQINYFSGCGGDCDKSCQQYIRPTINSVMRYQSLVCDAEESCYFGPPFDQYYAVNEQEIKKVLVGYN